MNKKCMKFVNFFFIIYIIFTIYLLFCSFNYDIVSTTIFSLFLVGIVLFLKYLNSKSSKLKKCLKILENKKFLIAILVLPIILRLLLLLFDYNDLSKMSNDYATFYNNAKNFASNSNLTSRYIAMFPYLFGYISGLGNFFKIFGVSSVNTILFNLIVDLFGALLCYLFMKKCYGKKTALISLFIWLYNPFNILWCLIPAPIIIVNTGIMLSLFAFTYVTNNLETTKKTILYSLILSIVLGFINSFRPIMIIFVIAVIIYYVYIFLAKKVCCKNLIISIILIFTGFSCYNYFNNSLISNYINIPVSTKSYGWSIYVGSNYNSKGAWFSDLEFNNKLNSENFTADEVHKYYFNKGLNNYKNNGLRNINHIFNKSVVLGSGISNSIISAIKTVLRLKLSDKIIFILKFVLDLFYFSILFINLKFYSIKFNKNKDNVFFLVLLILGMFSSTLFVEVASRYFLPIMVPLTLIASLIISIKYESLKR